MQPAGERRFVPRHEFSVTRHIVKLALAMSVIVGGWAASRAWWQVRDLYVSAPPGAIRPGWRPLIRVTTSGRKQVTVYVLLAQGARTDTIAVNRISGHRDGFWNPTFITRTFSPRVTRTQVSHFDAGLATLRVEAHGDPQWLRTPPPVIHEMPVHIAQAPAPQP